MLLATRLELTADGASEAVFLGPGITELVYLEVGGMEGLWLGPTLAEAVSEARPCVPRWQSLQRACWKLSVRIRVQEASPGGFRARERRPGCQRLPGCRLVFSDWTFVSCEPRVTEALVPGLTLRCMEP